MVAWHESRLCVREVEHDVVDHQVHRQQEEMQAQGGQVRLGPHLHQQQNHRHGLPRRERGGHVPQRLQDRQGVLGQEARESLLGLQFVLGKRPELRQGQVRWPRHLLPL